MPDSRLLRLSRSAIVGPCNSTGLFDFYISDVLAAVTRSSHSHFAAPMKKLRQPLSTLPSANSIVDCDSYALLLGCAAKTAIEYD